MIENRHCRDDNAAVHVVRVGEFNGGKRSSVYDTIDGLAATTAVP